MHLEKPPFLSGKDMAWKCIGLLILLLIVAATLYHCVDLGDHYLDIYDRAVTLEATVVNVEEDYDPEDGTEYDTIIGYTYQGKYYERIHSSYSTYKKAASHMGEKVMIQIDPEEPQNTLKAIRSDCAIFGCFGVIFLIAFVAVCCGPFRLRYVQSYGWNRSAIEMDIPIVLRHNYRFLSCFLPSAVGFFLLWRYREFAAVFIWVFNSILLLIGLIILGVYLHKRKLIKEGRYTIRQDTLIRKTTTYDSDDGTTYYFEFENGGGTWKKSVKAKLYDAMQEGDVMDAVYLEGTKLPLLLNSQEINL